MCVCVCVCVCVCLFVTYSIIDLRLLSVVQLTICKGCGCGDLVLSAGRPDHLKLFRMYVSRKAAGKGRAVLEGVELDTATISACISAHAQNEEEAVQEGLTKWVEGKGRQPPSWGLLVEAMEYAGIAQQHVQGLKVKLLRI